MTRSAALQFRPFEIRDLQACADLAAEAWPDFAALVPPDERGRFLRAYVRICLPYSTRLEVAELDGELVGFLFGSVERDYPGGWFKALAIYLGVSVKFLLGGYGRVRQPVTVMRRLVQTEKLAAQAKPHTDAGIELFVVSARQRGKGIGRQLLERFITHAESRGARAMSLYTDRLSNWGFYDHMGFQKVAEFPDELNAFLVGEPMLGSIYLRQLEPLI